MKTLNFLIIIISFCLLTSSSCKKDPVLPNPEEEITALFYTLTPSGGGPAAVFTFSDVDGSGGNPPIIQVDTLMANTTYTGDIVLLNASVNPVEDITSEVEAEGEDHQFFYTINGLHLTITYNDTDDQGFPVGLNTIATAAGISAGTIVITLRHNPDKAATGVSDGIITNAGGDTDIEVEFPVVIQ